jgi:hypothetical protein
MDDKTDGWTGHVKKLHEKRPQRPTMFELSHMFWAPIQMVKRETQMQHLRQWDKGCCFCALKKEEIIVVAGGGWGVTKYLQLSWMDDGTNGWMEKASRPQRPLLYVIFLSKSKQI